MLRDECNSKASYPGIYGEKERQLKESGEHPTKDFHHFTYRQTQVIDYILLYHLFRVSQLGKFLNSLYLDNWTKGWLPRIATVMGLEYSR